MAISSLTTQYISASFQNLMQVSSSGEVFNGSGTKITTLDVISTYALGSSGSSINTNSLATTGSNTFSGNQTFIGNIIVRGNLTANQYIVSSSVYYVTESYSSGSHKFGDTIDDIHQFTGSVNIKGALNVSGSITGSLLGTATNAVSASYTVTASYALSGIGAQGVQGTSIQGVQGTSIQGVQGTSIQGVQGVIGAQGVQGTSGIIVIPATSNPGASPPPAPATGDGTVIWDNTMGAGRLWIYNGTQWKYIDVQ